MLVQNAHKANSVVGEDRSHLFYIRPALSPAHYLVIILLSAAPFLLASLPFVHSFRFVLFSASLSSPQLSPSPSVLCSILLVSLITLPFRFCLLQWEVRMCKNEQNECKKKDRRSKKTSEKLPAGAAAKYIYIYKIRRSTGGMKLSHFHSQSVVKLVSQSIQTVPAQRLLALNSAFHGCRGGGSTHFGT